MVKGIINANYKTIIEVLVEIHFEIIARKNAMFVRSQITSQLGTLWINKRRHIISFIRAYRILGIRKSL
jgi:hypothetical protein